MPTELTKEEMIAIRDEAFASLRAAETEAAIVDAVNAASRAFYGDSRHLHPYVPVDVLFLDGTAHAYRAEACRTDEGSIESFRLWRLVDIATEAAVSTRHLRARHGRPSTELRAACPRKNEL